jgi:hypothetical protein
MEFDSSLVSNLAFQEGVVAVYRSCVQVCEKISKTAITSQKFFPYEIIVPSRDCIVCIRCCV